MITGIPNDSVVKNYRYFGQLYLLIVLSELFSKYPGSAKEYLKYLADIPQSINVPTFKKYLLFLLFFVFPSNTPLRTSSCLFLFDRTQFAQQTVVADCSHNRCTETSSYNTKCDIIIVTATTTK